MMYTDQKARSISSLFLVQVIRVLIWREDALVVVSEKAFKPLLGQPCVKLAKHVEQLVGDGLL